ncbi:MAG TPA: hypothetical protein VKG25_25675, partial [Bryobacteraceae bacterium]|nr:hypothetical protein [Bryobacteraceae bacterium]
RMELHGEGDGTQFPRLFIPQQSEINKETTPYLLLAKSLNLVQPAANPQTGAQEFVVVTKDENGFDTDPIYLGKVFSESVSKLDRRNADLIRDYVQKLLSSKENQLEAKRSEIQRAIVAEVDAIKAERGGNIQDEVYKQFLDGGRKAVAILKQEA